MTTATEYNTLQNFIGGHHRQARPEETLDLTNPATGQVTGNAPVSGDADVDLACRTAHTAFEKWRDVAPAQRQAQPDGHTRRSGVPCRRPRPSRGDPHRQAQSTAVPRPGPGAPARRSTGRPRP
ncbi:aldehyde dehydrogenase family protein [Streptomyces sp. NPDC001089]